MPTDYLFDPIHGSWVPVEGLKHGTGRFVVYDLGLEGANGFIAGGVFANMK